MITITSISPRQREFASTQFDSGQQGQAVFGREPDNEFATAIVLAR
jgi:hypothetical protein